MSAAPTFSLIVACRNPGPRLRTALDSIWVQRDVAVELIVIDGASTDGTREWLESERKRLAAAISEPDHGVYDAMNRGVALARGQWVLFLGADDRLADPDVLKTAAGLADKSLADVLCGEARYEDGRVYRYNDSINPVARNFVHHQATLYRRSVFDRVGSFDTTLSIMADYDFNLRLWKANVTWEPMPLRIAECGTRGLSDRGSWHGYREEIAVRHRYFSGPRVAWWDLGSVARFVRKQFVRNFPHRHG